MGSLRTQVRNRASAKRLRDIEPEESWWGDHARLREELARRGFDAAFTLKLPSGQHPIRIVVRGEGGQARRSAASSPAVLTLSAF